jgi:hypothetical protein
VKPSEVDDWVVFKMHGKRKDESELASLRLLLNNASGRWELWLDNPGGARITVITEARRRLRIKKDGTFDVLEEKVLIRRPVSERRRAQRLVDKKRREAE